MIMMMMCVSVVSAASLPPRDAGDDNVMFISNVNFRVDYLMNFVGSNYVYSV